MSSTTLSFRSEEALQLALTSGSIPAEVEAQPARVARPRRTGRCTIATDVPLPGGASALATAGIAVGPAAGGWRPGERTAARPGAGVLLGGAAARRDRDAASRRDRDPARCSSCRRNAEPVHRSLAGELLRLGCDRQEVCFARQRQGPPLALLRAAAPPYFTLTARAGCTAGPARLRARAPDSDASGLELGHTHPLGDRLRVPGRLLLVPGARPWRVRRRRAVAGSRAGSTSRSRPPRSGARAAARGAVGCRCASPARRGASPRACGCCRRARRCATRNRCERLVADAARGALARVHFAVAGRRGRAVLVLRARAGRKGRRSSRLLPMAYAPLLQLPGLYLPVTRWSSPRCAATACARSSPRAR